MKFKYHSDGTGSMWARITPGGGDLMRQHFAKMIGEYYEDDLHEILSFSLEFQPDGWPLRKALRWGGWTDWAHRDLKDWVPGLDMKKIVYEVAILRYRTPIEPFEAPEGFVYLGVRRTR